MECPLTTISLPFQTQCLLCFVSSLFSWMDNGACSLLRCDLNLRHPAHLLHWVPHQHTSGIISNHNMQNVNTGKFQNVRNVVSFIHLPCINYYSLAVWQVSEIFYVHNKTQNLLVEKPYLSVCLYSFVYPHHSCQSTAHTSL